MDVERDRALQSHLNRNGQSTAKLLCHPISLVVALLRIGGVNRLHGAECITSVRLFSGTALPGFLDHALAQYLIGDRRRHPARSGGVDPLTADAKIFEARINVPGHQATPFTSFIVPKVKRPWPLKYSPSAVERSGEKTISANPR